MHDPTRIPRVLDRLRETWEGQPDLPLSILFGILANRGASWGTTDEELEELLIREAQTHPAELARTEEGRVARDVLVETTAPDHRVTLTRSGDVVVRATGDRDRQPSQWRYQSVRPTGPGRLLVVADSEGVEHRLGMVTLITAFAAFTGNKARLEGIQREDIGNNVWLVVLDGGVRVLVTQRLHAWQVEGRSLKKTTHAWSQVVRCRVGEDFVYTAAGGGEVALGIVDKLLLIEQ